MSHVLSHTQASCTLRELANCKVNTATKAGNQSSPLGWMSEAWQPTSHSCQSCILEYSTTCQWVLVTWKNNAYQYLLHNMMVRFVQNVLTQIQWKSTATAEERWHHKQHFINMKLHTTNFHQMRHKCWKPKLTSWDGWVKHGSQPYAAANLAFLNTAPPANGFL